ncbi:hypothetical protein BGZ65_003382, partial [Modicella reniformis]
PEDGDYTASVKEPAVRIPYYLVGPGRFDSATESELEIGGVNVTKKLMKERDANIVDNSTLDQTDDILKVWFGLVRIGAIKRTVLTSGVQNI